MDDLVTQDLAKHPRKIYSVSQVNRIARQTLENFSGWVHGEVGELEKVRTRFDNIFLKFKLKDETTQYSLPVIIWPQIADNLDFELEDGLAVVVFGNLTLYEKAGSYQFQAQIVELFGQGLLAKKFEELKKKLRAEGLFDEKFKKPILAYPVKIGVVTSATSAAWSDFKKHTVDRFPFFEILLADVFVQGEQAVSDIVWALNRMNEENVEVIVLTRGGGSFEDLAGFNSEEVARAIAASQIPVIAAVGHERDETIADWVADVVASTPTAAAKLITANFEEFFTKEAQLSSALMSQASKFYQTKLLEISLLEKEFNDGVKNFVSQNFKTLENFSESLKRLPPLIAAGARNKLDNLYREIELLSPQKILDRGYSITFKHPEMKVIKEAKDIKIAQRIKVRLAKGRLTSQVLEIENN